MQTSYRRLSGLENLSGLLEVASLLHAFALHGRRFQLLQEGVGAAGAQQRVGLGRVREHWRTKDKENAA